MDGSSLTDPLVWAQETFGAAELGDRRRTRRLVRVVAEMAADPQGSLPREMSGNWADLKAAYRLVRADGVSMKQSVAQSGSKHVSRSSKSQGSCSSCMMIRSWIMAIVQPSVV